MGKQNTDGKRDWMPGLKVDFSAESSRKEEMKTALMQQLDRQNAAALRLQKENNTMRTGRKIKRSTAIALAACLALGAVSVTAYAVVRQLKLGQHAHYLLEDEMSQADREKAKAQYAALSLPEELLGQVFTKDGKQARTWGDVAEGSYDTEGREMELVTENMRIGTALKPTNMTEAVAKLDETSVRYESAGEVQSLLDFDLLDFGYVPEGYELEGYRLFKSDETTDMTDSKYLSMNFYKDGDVTKHIYVQARLMDEETSFESGGTEDIRKTTINGYDAIVDGSNVDILIDDVMYMIMVGDLPGEEAIKMAESLTAK